MFMKYSIVTRIYTEILINQAVDNFTSSRFRESRILVHHIPQKPLETFAFRIGSRVAIIHILGITFKFFRMIKISNRNNKK